jgi:diphthamide synthase (EF-2-diphthine--ammonia ligase)
MSDILTDYREWRASLEDRIGTHSAGCHMWPRHERCMIHRLAAALAAEQARRTDACGLHARESQRLQPDRTPEDDEIERLREAIRRLAEQDATLSVQGGNVTVTMDATLTDAEREAIAAGLGALESMYADAPPISRPIHDAHAPTLRGLMERTK